MFLSCIGLEANHQSAAKTNLVSCHDTELTTGTLSQLVQASSLAMLPAAEIQAERDIDQATGQGLIAAA